MSAVNISVHRSQRYADGVRVIDDGEAYSAGPRTWELAACEAFQVSDYRQEIADVFGDAIPFYDTPKELEVLLRRAIDDPVWRQEQAARQREAAQGHDCKQTMRTMLEAVA
jgi:spore maturation protein CgeB